MTHTDTEVQVQVQATQLRVLLRVSISGRVCSKRANAPLAIISHSVGYLAGVASRQWQYHGLQRTLLLYAYYYPFIQTQLEAVTSSNIYIFPSHYSGPLLADVQFEQTPCRNRTYPRIGQSPSALSLRLIQGLDRDATDCNRTTERESTRAAYQHATHST